MKKQTLLSAGLLSLLALFCIGRTMAAITVTSYTINAQTPQVHTFSSSAVSFEFEENTNMDELWLGPEKKDTIHTFSYAAPQPSTHIGVALGFTMPFAALEARYIGITAAGSLYFGADSAIKALANPERVVVNMTYTGYLKDYIYLRFGYLKHLSTNDLPLADPYSTGTVSAGAGAKVKYESTADGMYIGYENLKIYDYDSRDSLLVSFQYFVDKSGEITFIPVSIRPTAAPSRLSLGDYEYTEYNHYSVSLGLIGEGRGEYLWLRDFNGGSQTMTGYQQSIAYVSLTNTQYPQKAYTFTPPEECAAVSDNSITRWDYTVDATTITFSYSGSHMDWNEGNRLLLVLSLDSLLTGENLPQDKTEYKYGQTIGSSKGVMVGNITDRHGYYSSAFPMGENVFTGLNQATTYYIHAFPYSDDCFNGPVYKTTGVPKARVQTFALAPDKLEVSDVTQTSFKLTVDHTANYLLVVTGREIPVGTHINWQGTYEKGQKIDYVLYRSRGQGSSVVDTIHYVFEVVEPDGSASTVNITGATPGTDYYYYAWSNVDHGRAYSNDYARCGVSTVHPLGSESGLRLDFSTAVTSVNLDGSPVPAPAGWAYDAGNTHMFITNEDPDGTVIRVPLMTGIDGPARSAAVSPVIDKGTHRRLGATLELLFISEGMMGNSPYSPVGKDSVIVEYRNVGQTAWHRVGYATKDNAINPVTGELELETEGFDPEGEFQFRVIIRSEYAPANNLSTPYACLRAINVEPKLSCEKVKNMETVEAELLDTRARVIWEDGNVARSDGYLVRCRIGDTGRWSPFAFTPQAQYDFTGLRKLTEYTVEVVTVCKEGDTSLSRTAEFTTIADLPYNFTPQCCALPLGTRFRTGTVPATGHAVLSEVSSEYRVWELQSYRIPSAQGYGVGLENMSRENTANNLWYLLPPVSTGDVHGTLDIKIDMLGWAIEADGGSLAQAPHFKQGDLFDIYVSTDGNFSAANKTGSVDLTALADTARVYTIQAAVTGSKLYVAIYTQTDLPSIASTDNVWLNSLMINSIEMEIGETLCEPVTNIRQSNLGKTSIDISWKGEAVEFAVIYKPRGEGDYDTAYTAEKSITLENLIPGTSYEYRVFGYCEPNHQKPSEMSSTRYFNTIPDCITPEITVINVTWHNVKVACTPVSGNTQKRLFDLWVRGYEDDIRYHYKFANSHDTVTINNIFALGPGEDALIAAPFSIMCRAVCAEGDSSEWSEIVNFDSEELPPCGSVQNVKTEIDFDLRIAEMTWTPGENNIYHMVTYRPAGTTRYDTGWADYNTFRIVNLQLNTTYSWKIVPYCHQYYPGTASSGSFSTEELVAVEPEAAFEKAFKVSVSKNQLSIHNPAGFYVKGIEVYTVEGKLQRRYDVNSSDNVLLWHDLRQGLALIRIIGENGSVAVRKVVIQ